MTMGIYTLVNNLHILQFSPFLSLHAWKIWINLKSQFLPAPTVFFFFIQNLGEGATGD